MVVDKTTGGRPSGNDITEMVLFMLKTRRLRISGLACQAG